MKKKALILPALAAVLLAVPQTPYPCSSFAFPRKGGFVFGTNYDNPFQPGQLFINKRNVRKSGWEPGTTGRLAAWNSRYGNVTIACAGYQPAWSGMNEAGLVISTMALGETVVPAPDERPALSSALWVQFLFDTCASVEDVLRSEADVRISDTGDHYLICDARGDSAARVMINGQAVPPGPRFRQGIVRNAGGRPTMVIWLELVSASDTEVMVEVAKS